MALEWLKQRYTDVTATLETEVAKLKNKTFLEAVVAGCVLVAHADGTVTSEEKQKMLGYLRHSDVLSVFDVQDVIGLFDKYSKPFEFDPQIGQAGALQVVGRLKGKDSEARLMVRVCCIIGAADGHFDEQEKAVVRRICRDLSLDPADFDLA